MIPALNTLLFQPPTIQWLTGGLYTQTPAFTGKFHDQSAGILNKALSPDRKLNAMLVTEDGTAAQHDVGWNPGITTAVQPYTLTHYTKNIVGGRNLQIRVFDAGFGSSASVDVDPRTGAIITAPATSGSASGASVVTAPVGNGWIRIKLTFTFVVSAQTWFFFNHLAGTTQSYTGDAVSSIAYWGMDFR